MGPGEGRGGAGASAAQRRRRGPGKVADSTAAADLLPPAALDATTRQQVAQHAGDLHKGGYT